MTETAANLAIARTLEQMTGILSSPHDKASPQIYGVDTTFFDFTLSARDRVRTNLRSRIKSHEGNWYYQGSEPTCLPWSLINGCLGGNIEPDPGLAAALVNYANAVDDPQRTTGMDYPKALEILKDYSGAGFEIEPLDLSSSYKKGADELDERTWSYVVDETDYENDYGSTLLTKYLQEHFFHKYWPRNRAAEIKKNAARIVHLLDEGSVLLASVVQHRYVGLPLENSEQSHAICIPGYAVNRQSFLDLQVIDSARGTFWMSSEHLYGCLSLPCWKLVKN